MTIILRTQKKGEKPIRKEFEDDNHMDVSKEGLLIKLEDRSISVAIFSKGSKADVIFTKWEKLQ